MSLAGRRLAFVADETWRRVEAALVRRPRSRYQVPASARAMVAATKVVPSPVMDAVMGRMFGTHRR